MRLFPDHDDKSSYANWGLVNVFCTSKYCNIAVFRVTLAYAFSLSKAFLDNSPHCRIGIKLPGSMYTKQCRGNSAFPLVGTQTVILMYSFFIGERCLHGQLWQIQSGVTSAVLLFQNRIHNHHQYPVPTTMVHHHHHHHHWYHQLQQQRWSNRFIYKQLPTVFWLQHTEWAEKYAVVLRVVTSSMTNLEKFHC